MAVSRSGLVESLVIVGARALHRQWYVSAIAAAGGDGGARKGSSWPHKPCGTQAMLGESLGCPIRIEQFT